MTNPPDTQIIESENATLTVQIVFHLTEIMARYRVSVNALSDEMGVSTTSITQWRKGKTKPGLDRINEVMAALLKIGDQGQLRAFPLDLSDVLEWRVNKTDKLN
ncbi:MAG: helix-turn-helix transcriptional regulator [Cyanobacteria bacterium P01_F01_bin.13]